MKQANKIITMSFLPVHAVPAPFDTPAQRTVLEHAGFSINGLLPVSDALSHRGQPVAACARHVVVVPQGWTMQVDIDPRTSTLTLDFVDLHDEQGRFRAQYLPQVLALTFFPRFSVESHMDVADKKVSVVDFSKRSTKDPDGVPIWTSERVEPDPGAPALDAWRQKCVAVANAWLDVNKPDWRNPTAYW